MGGSPPDHCIAVLSNYLRGDRREFVGLVKLFHEYGIPLAYVAGMRMPEFVHIILLLLFAHCVQSKMRLQRSPSDIFSEAIVTFSNEIKSYTFSSF